MCVAFCLELCTSCVSKARVTVFNNPDKACPPACLSHIACSWTVELQGQNNKAGAQRKGVVMLLRRCKDQD